MTPEEIRAKKENIIRSAPMTQLLDMWAISELLPFDQSVADVRGWLMEELQRRDPEAFDRWLDSEYPDAQPKDFFKV